MHLFEKIFNHQIVSRLEDSGMFMVTSMEPAWLKTMLEPPAAADAFTADTLSKLRTMLEGDEAMDVSVHLIEKRAALRSRCTARFFAHCVGSSCGRAGFGLPTK